MTVSSWISNVHKEYQKQLEQQLWALESNLRKSSLTVREIELIKYITIAEIKKYITEKENNYGELSENTCTSVKYLIEYKNKVEDLFDKFL